MGFMKTHRRGGPGTIPIGMSGLETFFAYIEQCRAFGRGTFILYAQYTRVMVESLSEINYFFLVLFNMISLRFC